MASESATRTEIGGWSTDRLLDAAVTGFSVLMVLGIGLDARAHAEGISFAEEGFVTPEHVFFYSAFLAIAATIGAATLANRRRGDTWIGAIPAGYGVGVLGVVIFGFGGLGDFLWHSTFGFEEGLEALTSPTHQLLAVGGILFLTSPLRATWRRTDSPSGIGLVAAAVSATLGFALFGLFSSVINPVVSPEIFGSDDVALGVAQFMVFPGVLVAIGLVLSRRFDLPPGALTVIFVGGGLMALSRGVHLWPMLGSLVAAGLAADLLGWLYHPDRSGLALRLFGLAVPLAFGAAYMLIAQYGMAATTPFRVQIGWSVHVWTGAVTLGMLSGLIVTYVAVPDTREGTT